MPSLPQIVQEVSKKYRCHTLILYGSRARGDATIASDVDLIAISKGGVDVQRDTRKWRGVYLDLFVYPESKAKPSGLIQVRGGRVLKQKGRFGDLLLAKLDRMYRRGPKPISRDELNALKAWHRKMLDRVDVGDAEANFRRTWLLTALLEDYFVMRNRWYEGPKLSLQWLRLNSPGVYKCFDDALKPNADIASLRELVRAVSANR